MNPISVFTLGIAVIVITAASPWILTAVSIWISLRGEVDEDEADEIASKTYMASVIGAPIIAIVSLILGVFLLH